MSVLPAIAMVIATSLPSGSYDSSTGMLNLGHPAANASTALAALPVTAPASKKKSMDSMGLIRLPAKPGDHQSQLTSVRQAAELPAAHRFTSNLLILGPLPEESGRTNLPTGVESARLLPALVLRSVGYGPGFPVFVYPIQLAFGISVPAPKGLAFGSRIKCHRSCARGGGGLRIPSSLDPSFRNDLGRSEFSRNRHISSQHPGAICANILTRSRSHFLIHLTQALPSYFSIVRAAFAKKLPATYGSR